MIIDWNRGAFAQTAQYVSAAVIGVYIGYYTPPSAMGPASLISWIHAESYQRVKMSMSDHVKVSITASSVLRSKETDHSSIWYLGTPLAGRVFNPADIAGMQWWIKSDADTYKDAALTIPATTNGDVVKGWKDLSGNSRHFTEATNPPTLVIGGQGWKSSVRFDGISSRIKSTSFGLAQPHTILMAFRLIQDAGDFQALWIRPDAFSYNCWRSFSGIQLSINAGNSVQANWTGGTHSTIVAATYNGVASALQINNGVPTAGNAGAGALTNGLQLGKYATFNLFTNIDVYEFIGYNSALNSTQIASVVEYLNHRWSAYV